MRLGERLYLVELPRFGSTYHGNLSLCFRHVYTDDYAEE